MRESRTFGERTQVFATDKTCKKYFLVYEGSNTEVIYFDRICSMRENIGKLIESLRAY